MASLGAYLLQAWEGGMNREDRGRTERSSYELFISEYSGAVDEERTCQKNDKNWRESGIGTPKAIISVTRIEGELNDGSLTGAYIAADRCASKSGTRGESRISDWCEPADRLVNGRREGWG